MRRQRRNDCTTSGANVLRNAAPSAFTCDYQTACPRPTHPLHQWKAKRSIRTPLSCPRQGEDSPPQPAHQGNRHPGPPGPAQPGPHAHPAPVAQWIEQVPSKHLAAGSSPAGGTPSKVRPIMDAAALAAIHGLRPFNPSLACRLSHTLCEADKTTCDDQGVMPSSPTSRRTRPKRASSWKATYSSRWSSSGTLARRIPELGNDIELSRACPGLLAHREASVVNKADRLGCSPGHNQPEGRARSGV